MNSAIVTSIAVILLRLIQLIEQRSENRLLTEQFLEVLLQSISYQNKSSSRVLSVPTIVYFFRQRFSLAVDRQSQLVLVRTGVTGDILLDFRFEIAETRVL